MNNPNNIPQPQITPAQTTPTLEIETQDPTTNLTKVKTIKIAKKIVALSLIASSLYHVYIAVNEILFVFPQISFIGDANTANDLYIELVKKAIILTFGLFTEGFYGVSLLVKANVNTKIIHIVLGILLFIISNVIFKLAAINQLLEGLQFLPIT